MDAKRLLRPSIAILIAVLLTLIIGFNAGFPHNPDNFRQHAERLHQQGMAGVNLDNELVAEEALDASSIAAERYGFLGDSVRIMKWYAWLVALIYLFALILAKAHIKETVLVSVAASLVFLYSFGTSSSLLLAFVGALYVFLRLIFKPRVTKS